MKFFDFIHTVFLTKNHLEITMLEEKFNEILPFVLGQNFILTLSGRMSADMPFLRVVLPESPQKIVLKVVQLNNQPNLQLNCYTKKQHFTKNFEFSEQIVAETLTEILAQPFSQAHLQTPDGDFYFRAMPSKNGNTNKISTKKTPASRTNWNEELHNKSKNYAIMPENSSELLIALGICDEKGKIIPSMQAKYRQINHFLSIAETLEILKSPEKFDLLRIADCGCGKAYLSLALYHWLVNLRGFRVSLTGIDTNPQVIDFCKKTAARLGFDGVEFVCEPIGEFGTKPKNFDLVIALHACDTATDDALSLALRSNSRAILAAPCCHHYVNERLRATSAPESVSVILKDGISRERFADLLTDSLRRDILTCYGFSAGLLEFISPEHTMKNILIRAERENIPEKPNEKQVEAVREQNRLWHVAPKLAELMGIA